MKRMLITLGFVLVILIVAIAIVPSIVFGGLRVFTLKSAPPLTGQISQALTLNVNGKTSIETAGKDYNLENTQYFDNNTWVVTSIIPTDSSAQSSVVVLKKENYIYNVVLGPGTSFPGSAAKTMPSDLVQYLNQQGYLYGATQ